jgi:hypothetical protein
MSIASLCNTHTVDIERKTTSIVSGGGQSDVFAAAYEDVVCTIQPVSGGTLRRFDRMSMNISHTLYTPTAITLVAGDRVNDGGTYYIVQWFENQAAKSKVYAAHLLRTD